MLGPHRLLADGRRLKADLVLLAVAVIWGTGFVACRAAMAHIKPFLYTGVRFLLAALVLLPLSRPARRAPDRSRGWALTASQWRGALLAGLVLTAAISFQQVGLQFTTAGKAGFITGLTVVLVPLLLALFWRQRVPWMAWLASGIAAAGLFLLSGAGPLALGTGDSLTLVCTVFWALHVIVIGRLAPRIDVLRLAIAQYALCGVLTTMLGLMFEANSWSGLVAAGGAVVYTGIVSVAGGYTLQVIGQKHAPAADAAVLLSMEAVFTALFGWLLLGERLSPLQLAGCGLMLCGMLLAQWQAMAPRRHRLPGQDAREPEPVSAPMA